MSRTCFSKNQTVAPTARGGMTLLSDGVRDKTKIHTKHRKPAPVVTNDNIQCPRCKAMVPIIASASHPCRQAWLKGGMLDAQRLESTLRRVSGLSGIPSRPSEI